MRTPGRLRALLLASIVTCLLWGVVATWTAGQRLSAANQVVAGSGPLSAAGQATFTGDAANGDNDLRGLVAGMIVAALLMAAAAAWGAYRRLAEYR
jgi:hypothetical protein